ncbi:MULTISPECIES: helix-turn-helix transcriptional regulator [unclassified Microbacterium]|uniref:helix-turn-helix domain-containing protein n=1 Tax=unclassified Microbacterium TaxID=2609290 RepID=UPI0019D09857|nr:helix-turn-helix transcriptional regulator [Microbacterium sp. KRD172]
MGNKTRVDLIFLRCEMSYEVSELPDGIASNSSWLTFNKITEHAPGASVARRLDVSDSKVSYWRRGERHPTTREAVHVARACGRNPLEALLVGGHLDAGDIAGAVIVVHHTIADYSDVELAQEIVRRSKP